MEEPNRRKAKATGEVILNNDSIILIRRRDHLTLQKLSPDLRNTAILL
jgi:hypothetical protein